MADFGEKISTYLSSTFGEEFLRCYNDYADKMHTYYIRTSYAMDPDDLPAKLANYDIEVEKLPGIPGAYKVIKNEIKVAKTLEYTLGHYYIQSLSSMIPPLILDPRADEKILDMCAAPGSKTTEIADMLHNKGTIYANEISVSRMKSLIHNIDKMNYLDIGVIQSKGELLSKHFHNFFDKVLVDAPCSALGTMQKNADISEWWSTGHAKRISNIQFRLLFAALKMVKEGGEIIYSTCTLTLEENELILNEFLNKYPVEIEEIELPVPSRGAYTKYGDEQLNPKLKYAHRIIPWEVNSEGFFIAKLCKTGDVEASPLAKLPESRLKLVPARSRKVSRYLNYFSKKFGIPFEAFDEFQYLVRNQDIYFINKNWQGEKLKLFNRIGSKFAAVDRNDRPHFKSIAARVFSDYVTDNFVEIDDVNDLISYLSGGTIRKDITSGGQKIVKYKDYYLGTGIATERGLKSQFPRSKRTQEMIFPEPFEKFHPREE